MTTVYNWLLQRNLSPGLATPLSWIILILIVLFVSYLSHVITRRVLLSVIAYMVRKSKTKWDDSLLEHKVFSRLSHIAPALIVYFSAGLFAGLEAYIQRFSMAYMAFTGLSTANAFLNAGVDIYRTYDMSKQRPIKGYVQVIKIVFFLIVSTVALAMIMGQNPWALLTGFGAMTAVIMLIFKDTILGLVAGIQLSANDMVRIGDWIEMPKYGADGDVIDITLHTVKVQNWDKTISSIPSYSLVSESFINWRGMAESGGRRIKRAINIDIGSIKFCDDEMLQRFENIQFITDYIKSKKEELAKYNTENKFDTTLRVNGRNLTNIGTLRAYIVAYLKRHPKIRQDMTFLVRQLPPGEHGLPIEIYVFCSDQVWANYEAIQADIFDHLLAVIPLFDLRVFQQPTGSDFRHLGKAT